ncbi:serine/threonine-protein kinase 33-like [Anabrus simplex]|uniref:serine/threonine-protein kinase 33-like n=1 Tax=Anabrus simplex TaxID=316456 RepID=UPI0034DCC961
MEDPNDIQRRLFDFAEELGHGKFAKVIRAINKEYKDKWSIKIIAKNRNPGSDRMKNLMREIDILWRVDHPNILKLDQVIDTPKRLYLVLEMGTKALGTVLAEKKFFTEDESRYVMKQLCEAVAYLHNNDIVHKDLSLETVLLVRNPRDFNDEMYVKLTGFGASVTMSSWDCKYRLPAHIGNSFYSGEKVRLYLYY